MTTRAVSAARPLMPLAVLVPILATILGTFWALTVWPPLALLVWIAGLGLTALAGKRTYGARASVAFGVATSVTAAASLFLWAGFGPYISICGKHVDRAWEWLPFAGGLLVFLGLGSWGLRTYRIWGVPLALVLGLVVALLLVAAVPGTPGFCET